MFSFAINVVCCTVSYL